MSTQRNERAETRPLDILGIGDEEERAYRWLLAHPRASAQGVAQAMRLAPGKARRLLDGIEAKGLATGTPERPRRYVPVSPDISLEALAHRHMEKFQHLRRTIQELQAEAISTRAPDEREQMAELITSREAQRLITEQITRTARDEIIALVRKPLLISNPELTRDQDQFTQTEAQARGVRLRSIIDMELLTLPNAARRVREDIQAGEEVRVYLRLPIKMVLADRRVAVIPLDLQRADSPSLLVRSSALLDALYALFEILWDRAVPISFTRTGTPEIAHPSSAVRPDVVELIQLMATGLNDKKIASELRISLRTLERRVADLMNELGTQTRFQAGWLAALRLCGLEASAGRRRESKTP